MTTEKTIKEQVKEKFNIGCSTTFITCGKNGYCSSCSDKIEIFVEQLVRNSRTIAYKLKSLIDFPIGFLPPDQAIVDNLDKVIEFVRSEAREDERKKIVEVLKQQLTVWNENDQLVTAHQDWIVEEFMKELEEKFTK